MTSAAPLAGHPPSLYAATAIGATERPRLEGTTDADVCVIGAGYTGLSAALHLAGHGLSVVVLEAERAGWGASGRNGGQLHSGQRRDPFWLEERVGRDDAVKLFALAEDARRLVLDLIERYAITCDFRPGVIHAMHRQRAVAEEHAFVERLARDYGYKAIEPLDRAAISAALGTDCYFGGWRDSGGGHLHPLNFALGIAAAAETAGARIFEHSRAVRIVRKERPVVETERGAVRAQTVLLAGNGYMHGLEPELDRRVVPINNFVLATEPLGRERADALIPDRECAADSRFVINYWRITADERMVFGGGETYWQRFPADIAGFVRRYMLKIYPQLADCRIEYGWGGTLAITVHRVPFIRRLEPDVFAATGYCGQGIGIATHAGKLVADAIAKGDGTLDAYARLPVPVFPGGRLLRLPVLAAALCWYSLRDRL